MRWALALLLAGCAGNVPYCRATHGDARCEGGCEPYCVAADGTLEIYAPCDSRGIPCGARPHTDATCICGEDLP